MRIAKHHAGHRQMKRADVLESQHGNDGADMGIPAGELARS
jgi:hypothetical protein